ncbi:MAG TPA: NAD(P)/FAD-dependent oxidoreductase [Micromonosporaceae bacterium]
MYDVIIVGARAAGASTAMLLARRGLRVLAVDRASFPSDTLSTHQVQLPGVGRLAAWGLLDKVAASGAPATRHVRFDQDGIVIDGHFPRHDGVDALFSPRRTVLDALLVDAAGQAGAEVRESFTVDDVVRRDGRVAGIRGRDRAGGAVREERARLVVGADGKHSIVARAAGAPTYHVVPPRSMACYTYWEGVPVAGGELYARDRRAAGLWPTSDGLVMSYVAWPADEFATFRADVEGNLLETLDLIGVGERVRAGRRAERIRLTPDLPNALTRPYGPGWALVGDAGLVMDSITGQGIGDAFRDAELLADAVEAGLSGRASMDEALAGYQQARDRRTRPMYDFTTDLASFRPLRPEERLLFEALAADQAQTDRFFGVMTGAVPVREYFSPGNLIKLIGVRGFATAVRGRLMARRRRA